jgi:hypothetical protein
MAKPGTALITGASSGIGAAYADRLAKRGYDLVLVARSEERLKALAKQLTAETGVEVEVLTADLTLRANVRGIEQRLRSDASITLLVNNEGVIELNVISVHRLTIAAAQIFAARGRGGIINVSSIAALHPEQVNATYTATKAFVLNLTQGLHSEVAPKGVKVQVVLPGATRTQFFSRLGVSVDERFSPGKIMEATDLVDAALAGFDQGELVTIPSLPDVRDWNNFVAARLALGPNLSLSKPAARYCLSKSEGV